MCYILHSQAVGSAFVGKPEPVETAVAPRTAVVIVDTEHSVGSGPGRLYWLVLTELSE
jgi:hypothetical protein